MVDDVQTTFTLQDDGVRLIQSQSGEVPSTLTRQIVDDNTLQLVRIYVHCVSKKFPPLNAL